MAELEDELKVQNWLSIVTFDIYKYVEAGGQVRLENGRDGLRVTLVGITPDSAAANKKFRRLLEETLVETAAPVV